MSDNVIRMVEHTYHDIPRVLRNIADGIEAGEYGEVYDLVVVHRNSIEGIAVHGAGPRATIERVHMLLAKAQAWLLERHP